jgi:hypothetical protein
MRKRLINRVLKFAQSQFDSGLYKKARKEFRLAELPLRVTTAEDRTLDVTIEPYYRSLQEPLVILGEPGNGKTTLLYELATTLAPDNEQDPIAVPFDLSNWALNEGPLAEWLAAELKRNYSVSLSLARSWVNNETILPLLDGRDEVPVAKRVGCVQRINEYRTAHPEIKPVITGAAGRTCNQHHHGDGDQSRKPEASQRNRSGQRRARKSELHKNAHSKKGDAGAEPKGPLRLLASGSLA